MRRTRATLGSTGVFAEAEPTRASEPERARPGARPDRRGRVAMPFWATEAARKQLRLLAAERDTTQQDLMTEALNLVFKQYGKPPIA
jgi:PP-loop superfamily ATP-utilizing enzyme